MLIPQTIFGTAEKLFMGKYLE